MDEVLKSRIEKLVTSHRIFLFMKGTQEMPMCGFSAQAVKILEDYKADFKVFNVFDDEDIRQGIKEYSDWPTIPQLYVNGQFIGGSDILTQMHERGELETVLK